MSKSLGRLDVVQHVETKLDTQSSTVTFKPGRAIDFAALAKAVDKAGFKAGSITIWAKGTLSQTPDGRLMYTMSDSHQSFPVADSPEAAKLKTMLGKEIPLVAWVQFEKTPPQLVIGGEPAKAGMEGMGGMSGMSGMQGMPGMGAMDKVEAQPTHWIGVLVRDAKTDAEVQNLDITPTARQGNVTRTVKLMPVPGSYGANISLPQKGRYTVTLQVNRPCQPVQVAFDFAYE